MRRLFYISLLAFLFGMLNLHAQKKIDNSTTLVVKDSIKKTAIDPLRPAKAAFYSAILPGLGQAYNKHYWKVPVVYAALGTGIYAYTWNNKRYHSYRDAYKNRLAGRDDEYPFLDDSRLIQGQRVFQKNRDLSAIISVALYILNIVDANVDAHLQQFNVNDDLTIRPDIQQNELNNSSNFGIALSYHF